MKTSIYNILLISVLSISFYSCTENVVLDLRSAKPQLIIDASFPEDDACIVSLSTTQDYYDNSPQPMVTGATVTLSDGLGNSETLYEVRDGIYASPTLVGTPGLTYTLNVESEGKLYSSTAKFPLTVPIDSIYFLNIKVGSNDFYSPVVIYNDPPNIDNYYFYTLTVNGKRLKTIFINNDKYKDGKETDYILGFNSADNDDNDLAIGDDVVVEMSTINQSAYDFYASLYSTVTGNPISSFSGGAIGCFMTYGSSSIQTTISDDNTVVRK